MSRTNWESKKMLDVYIYDYLVKMKLHASANTFLTERKVSTDIIPINAPDGFLSEWWSVFWDIYNARTDDKAATDIDIDALLATTRESQLQQHLNPQFQPLQQHQQQQQQQLQMQQMSYQMHAQHQQQLQMQQMLYQIHAQRQQQHQHHQHRRDGSSDALMRQNLATSNGRDQLHSGILQPISMTQPLLPFNPHQLQQQQQQQQQQLMLQAQQNGHLDVYIQLQNSNQQQQQYVPWNLSPQHQQQDILSASGCMSVDDCMSTTHGGYEQDPERQNGRKRKEAMSSSGPANSSGTSNTVGPSPSSPSIHTHGDGVGFTLTEIHVLPASKSKVDCCHFSSDGKLLAIGGHDKKVLLWCTESFSVKSTLAEHGRWITDVRFSPSMSRLATSSADKTVKVWDADSPGYSLCTFEGHSSTVMSADFHPKNEDLVFSSDNNSEIRYWSIKNSSLAGVLQYKGGAAQLRFQPGLGKFLAAASKNFVSIFDADAGVYEQKLEGHKNKVESICWDPRGERLASVSGDMVRVWSFGSSAAECIHELRCSDRAFHTCVFHPTDGYLVVIGCDEALEVWNVREKSTVAVAVHAHQRVISGLAVSGVNGLIASASHDRYVKLWKCT